jgi:hypothetical protein
MAKYLIKPCLSNGVCRLQMGEELFTVNDADWLAFERGELHRLPDMTLKNVTLANNNLNRLAHLLKEYDITLYVMPIVDKYDLYYPYLLDKSYGQNRLFDYLRESNKEYVLIDTKAILSQLLDNKTRDIWYADDTHWSNIAEKYIIENTNFSSLKNDSPDRRK